jgi:EAL domain-containing protein (putative c-di-GMP-specific phosphodiesterase class I)
MTIEHIFYYLSEVINIDNRKITLKSSIGIAVAQADDNAEILLKKADTAMYKAKVKGDNSYVFADKDIGAEAAERLELENDLQVAIVQRKHEIEVYFQPKVNLKTKKIEFCMPETLARWQHPKKGLIPPGIFIPIAEETGLIVKMGEIIFEKACHEAAQWANKQLEFAVNFSPKQFMEDDIVETIEKIIKKTKINPQRIVIEITESMVMPDVTEKMHRLVQMGLKISVDDFGTGYSNLKSFQNLPISELKIDKCFIDDICNDDEKAKRLVEGIIALAHKLRLHVVAEGVEHKEQAIKLKRAGCDYIQGYYFSKPVPASKFAQLAFVKKEKPALS